MKKKTDAELIEYYRNEVARLHSQLTFKFQTDPVTHRASVEEDHRLYRKVGKKFIPDNDPYAYQGLRNGFWLIHVKDGSTAIRQEIYPATAHITAAARLMEDKLVDIIRKAGEARPNKASLTEEERKDWDKFIKKHGDSFNTLAYPSIQENAEKIVAALLGKDNKND